MSKVNDLILLAIAYSALLVVSMILPVWIIIPAGFVITFAIMLRKKVVHRQKIERIQQRLNSLQSEGLYIEGKVKGTENDVFYQMIMTLLTDLERSLFKLVEKNIQLLSLKEIGRNIISSLDEQKLIDSVFDYLIRGVGYREAAFIVLRKRKKCFQAIVCIEKQTRVLRRTMNFGIEDLKDAVHKSFISGKPLLIKDVQMHPLANLAGEELFPQSTMTSYLCVPLVKSSGNDRCYKSESCILKMQMEGEEDSTGHLYLQSDECLSCPNLPLIGALIVTDGYRATPLTNIDQVTIETVGSLVSSNIENWLLYQDLRKEEIFRENILEGMINGVFVIDLDGNVALANRRAREMIGATQNRILELSINNIILDEENGGEHESPVFRVLKGNTSLAFYEAYLNRADGLHIPIRMNVSPFFNEENEKQGAIIEFLDLSDIKRMEEKIRYLDRLAALGRFTSAVAHEIRNPLTGIGAGIQYLNRDEQLSSEQR
ncbi:MAG: PAS domain S-box protein, partial [Candidatus Krumholzibacteria bacterium]|nr:PAS domain S-box protein [Candidatus Krumholzibacteria bacterium]